MQCPLISFHFKAHTGDPTWGMLTFGHCLPLGMFRLLALAKCVAVYLRSCLVLLLPVHTPHNERASTAYTCTAEALRIVCYNHFETQVFIGIRIRYTAKLRDVYGIRLRLRGGIPSCLRGCIRMGNDLRGGIRVYSTMVAWLLRTYTELPNIASGCSESQ